MQRSKYLLGGGMKTKHDVIPYFASLNSIFFKLGDDYGLIVHIHPFNPKVLYFSAQNCALQF